MSDKNDTRYIFQFRFHHRRKRCYWKRSTIDVSQYTSYKRLGCQPYVKALPLNRGCHLVLKVDHLEMLIRHNDEQFNQDIIRGIVALQFHWSVQFIFSRNRCAQYHFRWFKYYWWLRFASAHHRLFLIFLHVLIIVDT
jgi:hypothetical protein